MRSDGIVKHLVMAFVLAVGLYIVAFSWIQHRRTYRGPWRVTFASDAAGRPSVRVSEPALKISELLIFPGQTIAVTKLNRTESFEEQMTNLPFGQWLFQDPTFLPGTLTMRLFGHEIEFLPRVLIVDKKEIQWKAGDVIQVR